MTTLTLTPVEIRALGTVIEYLRKDYGDGHPARCVELLKKVHKRALAPLADDDGPGEEDGPWAEGFEERVR
jgi:hypothetical protein